ncbi:MAG TPA: glycine cleavage system protein GcvH [Oligoflexia bacterium]|nr:glycine cleavage system protein GcvH [Oligoflexia bacterium]HMP26564.1 glycine cleavage system protein GcvH [Oligoflexia bacterium]
MKIKDDLKYTKDHEWCRLLDGIVVVGITDFAQSELGEIVHVKLPPLGKNVQAGSSFCVVDSTKAASDIYAPISGVVTEVNSYLLDHPETINQDPYGDGWIAKIKVADPAELNSLLDFEAYKKLLGV